MSDRWMTYADAAVALGMTPESVRQRARREHWRKQLGNAGKALILVPIDADRIPAGDTVDDTPAPRPATRAQPDTVALQARIADLEARARELKADVERERGERLQERERSERLTNEVADLARQLARITEEAGSRERELQARVAKTEAELAAAMARAAERQNRPWWKRFAS